MTPDLEKLAAGACWARDPDHEAQCPHYNPDQPQNWCAPCLARALLPRWKKLEAVEKAARAWRQQTTLTESTKHLWPALDGIWDALEALDAAEGP